MTLSDTAALVLGYRCPRYVVRYRHFGTWYLHYVHRYLEYDISHCVGSVKMTTVTIIVFRR